jgi:hypothetical protein
MYIFSSPLFYAIGHDDEPKLFTTVSQIFTTKNFAKCRRRRTPEVFAKIEYYLQSQSCQIFVVFAMK